MFRENLKIVLEIHENFLEFFNKFMENYRRILQRFRKNFTIFPSTVIYSFNNNFANFVGRCLKEFTIAGKL